MAANKPNVKADIDIDMASLVSGRGRNLAQIKGRIAQYASIFQSSQRGTVPLVPVAGEDEKEPPGVVLSEDERIAGEAIRTMETLIGLPTSVTTKLQEVRDAINSHGLTPELMEDLEKMINYWTTSGVFASE